MKKFQVGAAIALISLVGFLAVFAFLGFMVVPGENKDLFNTALIALIGFAGTGVGYFLGSSDGSAKKSDLLAGKPPEA